MAQVCGKVLDETQQSRRIRQANSASLGWASAGWAVPQQGLSRLSAAWAAPRQALGNLGNPSAGLGQVLGSLGNPSAGQPLGMAGAPWQAPGSPSTQLGRPRQPAQQTQHHSASARQALVGPSWARQLIALLGSLPPAGLTLLGSLSSYPTARPSWPNTPRQLVQLT